MFKKLLISLLFIVPIGAKAEWVQVMEDSEFLTYLDGERMKATNESLGYAEAWVKQVVHTDLSKDGLGVDDYRLFKYSFKCNSNQFALVEVHAYKGSKNIDSHRNSSLDYESLIPDTNGEDLFNIVCHIVYKPE